MEPDIKLLYDDLYNQADKVLKKYDPCKIDGNQCIRGTNPCCLGCPHIDKDEGCTVLSLGCKLHLCPGARESVNEECLKKLLAIRQEAVNNNIPLIGRASKEETFSKTVPNHCFILHKVYWEWGIK